MEKPSYVIKNGFRWVVPYYHTYRTTAKKRWFGKHVEKIFNKELRFSVDECEKMIRQSNLYVIRRDLVKKQFVEIKSASVFDINICDGDIIVNTQHKHEPPVLDGELTYKTALFSSLSESSSLMKSFSSLYYSNIYKKRCDFQIVYEDDDILVLNKPSGIPVHPTKNYFYNSITEILKYQFELNKCNGNMYPTHRLDMVTSGVLIIAKDPATAKIMGDKMRFKKFVKKQYYARVEGKFPDGEVISNDPIFKLDPTRNKIEDDQKYMDIPVRDAKTVFKRIKYNLELNESIVQCDLMTGRTHQIRIHLRNMGFPILNDCMYGSKSVYPKKNQMEIRILREQLGSWQEIMEKRNNNIASDFELDKQEKLDIVLEITKKKKKKADDEAYILQLKIEYYQIIKDEFQERINNFQTNASSICEECSSPILENTRLEEDLMLYLHSYNYEFYKESGELEYKFTTETPIWADI